jgi:tRNA-Thr(GGU) m(6)t(6)A37 methyltransferase TsaA
MDFVINPIGIVRSTLTNLDQCPHQGKEGAPEAWLEIYPNFTEALKGLAPGSEIIILTWMHLADRSALEVHPQQNMKKPLTGVFATRSPDRPNPIGLHRVTVVDLSPPNKLLVKPLEALDKTPIVDIKIQLSDDL